MRSSRSIMVALLNIHGPTLNDESLQSLLAEVEAIVKTRPITSEPLSDVHSPFAWYPMKLVTMKSRISMPSWKYILGNNRDKCNT